MYEGQLDAYVSDLIKLLILEKLRKVVSRCPNYGCHLISRYKRLDLDGGPHHGLHPVRTCEMFTERDRRPDHLRRT